MPDLPSGAKPQEQNEELIPTQNPYEIEDFDDVEEEEETPVIKPKKKVAQSLTPNENVIVLPDGKIPVTFRFKVMYDGKERDMSIGIDARSISVDSTSISLLYTEDIRLEFPVPAAFTIETNGIERPVAYFGGKHKLGKLTYISFLLIQE